MYSELSISVPSAPADSYRICIGANILASVQARLPQRFAHCRRFVVTDENVAAAGHLSALTTDCKCCAYVIRPAGEVSKHMRTVISIIEEMEKAGFGRDTLVIGLGGGTVGDIAGFAAAVFKRGVPVVHVPTTSVAQADSSIGGKTGVDSTISKNAFGAFWHPSAVYIDVATLQTLDEREYRAGLVESVKHALICDAQYFEFIEANIASLLRRDISVLAELASRNGSIKGHIVEEDPGEKNLRRILNYGHTVGHAVESVSDFALLHGEAVAIGIIAAGLIEQELTLGESKRLERVRSIFERLDVPQRIPADLSTEAIINRLRHDKKAIGGQPRFVLLSDLAEVHCPEGQYAVEVPPEVVAKVISKLK